MKTKQQELRQTKKEQKTILRILRKGVAHRMIAKKPAKKAKENKFIAASKTSKNGAGELIPVLLKVPSDLLDWLTAKAVEDGRPRTVYIVRALADHRTRAESGE